MTTAPSRRVLVVEDNVVVAMLLEEALVDAGCIVLGPAASVAEALALIADRTPCAAVLALDLMAESPAPVAEALAARGVPFVVMEACGASVAPSRVGPPVLVKPFGPQALVSALGRAAA